MEFSRQEYWSGFTSPRDLPSNQTWFSCIAGRFFTIWATREALCYYTKWRGRQYHMVSLICRIKKIYKWTHLQNGLTDLENKLMVTYGKDLGERWNRMGVLDWHVHTATFKTENQQGLTVCHNELCSIFCNKLNGKRIWKRIDICVCITESLSCIPEANTTLLTNCSPT